MSVTPRKSNVFLQVELEIPAAELVDHADDELGSLAARLLAAKREPAARGLKALRDSIRDPERGPEPTKRPNCPLSCLQHALRALTTVQPISAGLSYRAAISSFSEEAMTDNERAFELLLVPVSGATYEATLVEALQKRLGAATFGAISGEREVIHLWRLDCGQELHARFLRPGLDKVQRSC